MPPKRLRPKRARSAPESSQKIADFRISLSLSQSEFAKRLGASTLAAPVEWCPNPKSTMCLRVKGNSMSPLILDGYIIAVDTLDVRHDKLVGHIVVAWNVERGLIVSRLIRFDHTDVLVSDRREYESISLAAESKWRIIGKVLWWIGRAG